MIDVFDTATPATPATPTTPTTPATPTTPTTPAGAFFEGTWRDGYRYYERYSTSPGVSEHNRIDLPFEWYEPSSTGNYSSILDSNIRLSKKQGSSKNARGHYGVLDPMYRNIRDKYWNHDVNGYNKSPRVWYIDIETRSGASYAHKAIGVITIRHRGTDDAETFPTADVQNRFMNHDIDAYEYLTPEGDWCALRGCFYMKRNTGFPDPGRALEEITLVQIYDTTEGVMIVLGLRDWVHQSEYADKYSGDYTVKYVRCDSELQLMQRYLQIFSKLNPLILYAWSGLGFDYPYIYNRLTRLGLDTNALSNYADCTMSDKEYKGRVEYKLITPGHYYIDMVHVYKKFTMQARENYKLDTIAEIELGTRKIQHTEYAAFDDFYTGKYVTPKHPTEEQTNSSIYKAAVSGDTAAVRELAHSEFVYYGVVDVHLLKELDDKRNFTELLIMTAEKMGVQIGDAMGTVKPWAQYIGNKAHTTRRVMPPRQEFDKPEVVGGYVRDVQHGKHRWVLSADVNSMYPLLGMVGFNMSPETYVSKKDIPADLRDLLLSYFNDQDEAARLDLPTEVTDVVIAALTKHGLSLAMNGALFRQSEIGLIPELVTDIYTDRKSVKTRQFKYEQRNILIQNILNARNGT